MARRTPGRPGRGVACPACGGAGTAVETRQGPGFLRRRRECAAGHRWTTYEYVAGGTWRPAAGPGGGTAGAVQGGPLATFRDDRRLVLSEVRRLVDEAAADLLRAGGQKGAGG